MVQHTERARTPGRNDPCPCGSGKKYKRCCLLRVSTPAVPRREDVLVQVQATEAAGDAAAALSLLEETLTELHDPDLATMLVERLVALPPEEAEPRLRAWWDETHDRFSGAGLASVLAADGRSDEALTVLTESQGSEAWPEYWRLLATLREEQGDSAAAASALELYTRLVAESAPAWLMLADLQDRLGRHDRALAALRRAGDLLPHLLRPRLARLRIMAEQGRPREARDLAEALLNGSYEDATPEALYELRDRLAQAYFVLGEFDAARRLWETLLSEQPENGETRHQLATLEFSLGHHSRVVSLLPAVDTLDLRLLNLRLRSLLALQEFDEATRTAMAIERREPALHLLPLVRAAQAAARREYAWALEQLEGEPLDPYVDCWHHLRLDCLAHLGRWQEIWPSLRAIAQPDDPIFLRAALGALAAGRLDVAERLLARIEDQQSLEVRSLTALLGPVRQSRRAAEARRQQQVDQAERQRWANETRDLQRHLRELELHNAALGEKLALSEASLERLLERVGVLAHDSGTTWEAHVQGMAERVHKDALAQELREAEQRLRSLLGSTCWEGLSEGARAALREGEWLYVAVDGDDRDYGAALLEFARGLERAYKDAIFLPASRAWERAPGPVERLQDEGHDPSLGPFVRFVLQESHLTLGSMAAALDRMSDPRRQGVAVSLLRRILHLDPFDERALADWKRTAERLAIAADARNHPAHAAMVSREAVREFRELVLSTDGLLHALTFCN